MDHLAENSESTYLCKPEFNIMQAKATSVKNSKGKANSAVANSQATPKPTKKKNVTNDNSAASQTDEVDHTVVAQSKGNGKRQAESNSEQPQKKSKKKNKKKGNKGTESTQPQQSDKFDIGAIFDQQKVIKKQKTELINKEIATTNTLKKQRQERSKLDDIISGNVSAGSKRVDGLKIYSESDLGLDKPRKKATTADCPFDCDCCF